MFVSRLVETSIWLGRLPKESALITSFVLILSPGIRMCFSIGRANRLWLGFMMIARRGILSMRYLFIFLRGYFYKYWFMNKEFV